MHFKCILKYNISKVQWSKKTYLVSWHKRDNTIVYILVVLIFWGKKKQILDLKSLTQNHARDNSVLTPIITISCRFVQALIKWSIFLSEAVSLFSWGLSWNQPVCFTLLQMWLVRTHRDVDRLWHDHFEMQIWISLKGILLLSCHSKLFV